MARKQDPMTFAGALEVQAQKPLDARRKVTLIADLTEAASFPYIYKGLDVFCEENDKWYTFLGGDQTDIKNWRKEGSGEGGETPTLDAVLKKGNTSTENATVGNLYTVNVSGNRTDVEPAGITTTYLYEGKDNQKNAGLMYDAVFLEHLEKQPNGTYLPVTDFAVNSNGNVDMNDAVKQGFKNVLEVPEAYDDTALAARVSANETAIADRYTKAETDDLIEGEHIELTQAQYTALPEEEKNNGKVYFITDGGAYVPAVDLIPYVNQAPIVVGKLDLRGDGEFRDIKRVRLWINDLKNASGTITAGWIETGVYVRPIRIYGWFTFHDTEETQTSWTYRIQQLPIPYSGYNPIGAPSGNTIGLKFYVDYNNKLRMVVEGKSNFHTEDHACVIVDFMETPVA